MQSQRERHSKTSTNGQNAAEALSSVERAKIDEIGRLILGSRRFDDIFGEFEQLIQEVVPYDRLCVVVFDELAGEMVVSYVDGEQLEGWEEGSRHPADSTLDAATVGPGQSFRWDEADTIEFADQKENFRALLDAGFKSTLLVPLTSAGLPIGGLGFSSRESGKYSSRELEVARRVGAMLAAALSNSLLYEQSQRDVKEREILASIGSIIGSSLDIEDVYAEFAKKTRELIHHDRLVVSIFDPDADELVVTYVNGTKVEGWERGARHSLDATPNARTVMSGRTINFRQEEASILAQNNDIARIRFRHGLKSLCALPLISRGRPIGVLTFTTRAATGYLPSEVRSAEAVGALLAAALSNSLLHEQSQRDVYERKILADAAFTLNSSLDIEEVYQAFASHLKDLIGFDRLAITTLSADYSVSTIRHVSGVGAGDFPPGHAKPVRGRVEQMIDTRRGLLFAEESPRRLIGKLGYEDERTVPIEKYGFTSVVTSPLVSKDEIFGMVTAWSTKKPGYTEHDLQLLQEISPHISSAMTNSELYEESQRSIAEREILAQASSILHQTLELDEVYAEFADYINRLIGYDRMDVLTLSGNPLVSTIRHVAGEAVKEFPPGWSKPISPAMAKIIETGEAVLFDFASPSELSDAAGHEDDLRLAIEKYGVTSQLSAPLFVRGEVTGAVNTYSSSSPGYSERDLRLLKEVATYISSAMANSALYRATQSEARGMALVADIGAAVNSDLDLDTIFERVADGLENVIQFDRMTINLIDPDDSDINWMAYEWGLRRPNMSVGQRFRSPGLGKFEVGLVGDISEHEPPPETWLTDLGLKSFMSVKLRGDGDATIGLISVRARKANLYRERDLELLKLIATQISPAIKNAQIMTQIEALTRQEERSRFSRDMHDSVAQGLNSLNLQLDALESSLDSPSDEHRQLLEGVREAAAFALIETRNAIWNLRPEQLSNFGLQDAIKQEIERLVAPTRIKHTFVVNGTPASLAPMIELTVLRVCQETVANAVRHARATKIEVSLHYGPNSLELQISDDGRGFDAETVLSTLNSGSGLNNLIERSRQVSGKLEINSSLSRGTTIVLTVEREEPSDVDVEPGD